MRCAPSHPTYFTRTPQSCRCCSSVSPTTAHRAPLQLAAHTWLEDSIRHKRGTSHRIFAMATNATAFTSPLANANYGSLNVPPQVEYFVNAVSNLSLWTALWTLLALAVVYDQGMPFNSDSNHSGTLAR